MTTKTRIQRLGASVLLALVVAFGLLYTFAGVETASADNTHMVKVEEGETLWSIANRYFGVPSVAAVEELKAANGLESDFIVTGQNLVLPETWPQYNEISPEDMAAIKAGMRQISGGMLNSFTGQHYNAIGNVWQPFENSAGYWPYSGESKPTYSVTLSTNESWTIYPLGVRYVPAENAVYYQEVGGWGESGLFYGQGWQKLNFEEMVLLGTYPDDLIDEMVATYYFANNMHYATRVMFWADEANNTITAEVFLMSLLETEMVDQPDSWQQEFMPQELGVDVNAVDWQIAEPLYVAEVSYIWDVVTPITKTAQWQITYPFWDYSLLVRQDGEQVLLTGYYDLFIDRGRSAGGHPVQGETLWVRPYTVYTLGEPGEYGYLALSDMDPHPRMNNLEDDAVWDAYRDGNIEEVYVGVISGTQIITGTYSDGTEWSFDAIALEDGRHVRMNQYYKPNDGACVMIPLWTAAFREENYAYAVAAIFEFDMSVQFLTCDELSEWEDDPAFLLNQLSVGGYTWFTDDVPLGLPYDGLDNRRR